MNFNKIFYTVLVLLIIGLISSCEKDAIIGEKQLDLHQSEGYLSAELSEEEIIVQAFLSKLAEAKENPNCDECSSWTFTEEELIWNIEAALNYKYFTFAIDYESDTLVELNSNCYKEGEEFSISEVVSIYDDVLDNIQEEYSQFQVDSKRPIMIDLYEVAENIVNYRFIIGFGEIDLNEFEGEFDTDGSFVDYRVSAGLVQSKLRYLWGQSQSYVNDLPSGTRRFYTNIQVEKFKPLDYINPDDSIPADGYWTCV
jgi:hypothetical protein